MTGVFASALAFLVQTWAQRQLSAARTALASRWSRCGRRSSATGSRRPPRRGRLDRRGADHGRDRRRRARGRRGGAPPVAPPLMDAVLLALGSAALFGAMTVALRLALLRNPDARLGAAVTALVALAVALAATPVTSAAPRSRATWRSSLPQACSRRASRSCSSRSPSATRGRRGLRSWSARRLVITVALGIVLLDEPFEPALLAGAALIVAGGTALAGERLRPATFRAIGMAWAVGCTVLFACRDTFVRWFSGETPVASTDAAAATLLGGAVVLTVAAAGRPGVGPWRSFRSGSASGSRTCCSSRPSTAGGSRSSRRSSRPRRSGASGCRRS